MHSLRGRLTAAVMMPLILLALIFGSITCWVIHNTVSTTADHTLVASTRTLARAVGADCHLRPDLLSVALSLLHTQAELRPIYSIHAGEALLAGSAELPVPKGFEEGAKAEFVRHEPAAFPSSLPDETIDQLRDNNHVIQPAYLRNSMLGQRPVRIATQISLPPICGYPIIVQTGEFLDEREAYQQVYYMRVAGAAILTVLAALLLFYGAITWGLGPFASLTAQIDKASQRLQSNVRVVLSDDDPLEARVLAATFNHLMACNEQATQSLRQFTADASHQLRTPLAIVRVHTEVLSRYGADSPQGQTALQDIVTAVDSLDRLLTQLIALARLDEPASTALLSEPFDVSALAATVMANRVVHPDTVAMDLGFEDPDGPLMALGNELLATEMIANLLDNAIRYNRADGMVTVRVLMREGALAVEIEDNGPGISPANREKVWDRFYRVPGADAPSGSGLGLPIVRALGERMGARTILEDGPNGQGLRAVILFRPLSDAQTDQDNSATSAYTTGC